MDSNFSLPFLNETFVNISIIPAEVENQDEPRNLNLTWKVKNFTKDVLNISVSFDNAIQVSVYEEKDKIIFEAKNASEIFRAVKGYEVNMTSSIEDCPI